MATSRKPPASIDDYIGGFPPDVQSILERIRATVRKAAPEAKETISYAIPCFNLEWRARVFRGLQASRRLLSAGEG